MVKSILELNQEFMEESEHNPAAAKRPAMQMVAVKPVSQQGVVKQTNEAKKAEKSGKTKDTKVDKQNIRESVAAKARPAQPIPLWKDLLFLMLKITAIALAFVLLFTFLFGFVRYQEHNMDPAIKDGDLVLFYRYTKAGYQPRDTIVLKVDGKVQVRRVIATAGDTVDITEEGLFINGALQQEMDIHQNTERYIDGVSFPLTVPEGEVFVLGDSRSDAADSRIYGCVSIEVTMGKVMTVIRRRSI